MKISSRVQALRVMMLSEWQTPGRMRGKVIGGSKVGSDMRVKIILGFRIKTELYTGACTFFQRSYKRY